MAVSSALTVLSYKFKKGAIIVDDKLHEFKTTSRKQIGILTLFDCEFSDADGLSALQNEELVFCGLYCCLQ